MSLYAKYAKYALNYIFLHLIWSEDAVNTDNTPVQRDRRQAKCTMYHGIHTENEQFYHDLEAPKARHTCPSLQHCHAEYIPTAGLPTGLNYWRPQSILLWIPGSALTGIHRAFSYGY